MKEKMAREEAKLKRVQQKIEEAKRKERTRMTIEELI